MARLSPSAVSQRGMAPADPSRACAVRNTGRGVIPLAGQQFKHGQPRWAIGSHCQLQGRARETRATARPPFSSSPLPQPRWLRRSSCLSWMLPQTARQTACVQRSCTCAAPCIWPGRGRGEVSGLLTRGECATPACRRAESRACCACTHMLFPAVKVKVEVEVEVTCHRSVCCRIENRGSLSVSLHLSPSALSCPLACDYRVLLPRTPEPWAPPRSTLIASVAGRGGLSVKSQFVRHAASISVWPAPPSSPQISWSRLQGARGGTVSLHIILDGCSLAPLVGCGGTAGAILHAESQEH